jgi:hypothetical protein
MLKARKAQGFREEDFDQVDTDDTLEEEEP